MTAISTSMPRIKQVWRALRQQRKTKQQHKNSGAEHLERRCRRTDRIFRLGDRPDLPLRAAKQPVRPHDQHHRHHQEFGDQRQLGEVDGDKPEIDHANADADCFNLGDDHGGEIGAGDRAHAANNDDHEGVADHDQIGGKVCRLARNLQRAAKACEHRADRKHRSEQKRLIDAERAHHFAILRSGAHKPAETRAGKREMQRQQHQRAHHD